jgi:8-oxo-dGTP pyrophosphatase MutT (NUDIX family)
MVAVVLKCIEDSKLYSVLVHQPRIGCGRIMYEFPAGMTDDAHDFRAVGARELREEVGLDCGADDLIPLSELFRPERPFAYLNTSHYDEAIHLFMIAREMHRDEIFTFEGKHCGADHDEQITLHVVLFDDVWRYSDEPATLVAQFMVRDVIRRGVVKL